MAWNTLPWENGPGAENNWAATPISQIGKWGGNDWGKLTGFQGQTYFHDRDSEGTNPEFLSFLREGGFNPMFRDLGNNTLEYQLFNKAGAGVGNPHQVKIDPAGDLRGILGIASLPFAFSGLQQLSALGVPEAAGAFNPAFEVPFAGGGGFSSAWEVPFAVGGGGGGFNPAWQVPFAGGGGGSSLPIGKLLSAIGGGGSFGDLSMGDWGSLVQSLANIGGGLYGFGQMRDISKLLEMPSDVTKLPGYQAGLDAVERKLASQGFNGSGNMMAALAQYGGEFWRQEAARRAMMAQVLGGNLSGEMSALGLLGSGVKSLFGPAGGGGSQLQQLLSLLGG